MASSGRGVAVRLTDGPSGVVASTTAAFVAAISVERDELFAVSCALDGRPSPCAVVRGRDGHRHGRRAHDRGVVVRGSVSGLGEGRHSYVVLATVRAHRKRLKVSAVREWTVDTTAPVLSTVDDVEAIAGADGQAAVPFAVPTATDASGPPVVSCSPAPGSAFPVGSTTVTCTARDVAGNQAAVSFRVVVTVATPAPSVISAGHRHTCALTAAGGVRCWGWNRFGQLGDGTSVDRPSPVDVVGLAGGVTSVSAGATSTCAVTAAGGVSCWGENSSGKLGDGTTDNRLAPVNVIGLSSGVRAVSTSNLIACALTVSGGVKCWGYNGNGGLGDGTTYSRSTPVDVVGLSGGVTAISAGSAQACALTVAGGVKCWGANARGALGDGTTVDRTTPVDVVGLSGGVSAISAGFAHACALTTAGGVECWGSNATGQLGDGTTTDRATPVDVVGLSSGVLAISASWSHTCALTTAGGVKCWGSNVTGELGDGTTVDRTTPVDVVGLSTGVAAVSSGTEHTCATMIAGGIKCWGLNSFGGVGDGTTIQRSTPVDVIGLYDGAAVSAVDAGGGHTCALTGVGGVECWGANHLNTLGDGTDVQRLTPVGVVGLSSGVSMISAGSNHSCAVTAARGVACWGWNELGWLGDGTTTVRTTPVQVVGLSGDVTSVSVGSQHTCALTAVGGVECWGWNADGGIGDGTNVERRTPVGVVGLSSGVTAVSAGSSHTCAVLVAGGVRCWGGIATGLSEAVLLGDGATLGSTTPVDVVGLAGGVRAVTAGLAHSCALTAAGGVKCWGKNESGRLGDGTTIDRPTPVDVAGLTSGVVAISAGTFHTCALTTAGGVRCWGRNNGALGDGTSTGSSTPVDVVGLPAGVVAISAGWDHTCALTATGSVKCWGWNYHGALGDGTTVDTLTPVDVVGLSA